eukprot:7637540-Pyramimonas_sp.AAC.1
MGVPNRVRVRHVDPAVGTFGGAPYGVRKRVRGVPTWWTCGEQRPGGEKGERRGRKEAGERGA